jgi:hypothetical protein
MVGSIVSVSIRERRSEKDVFGIGDDFKKAEPVSRTRAMTYPQKLSPPANVMTVTFRESSEVWETTSVLRRTLMS